ncbi:hypothetical protein ACFFX0_16390 [Citricoccus parietis]|uniref:Uncharacterized protein n=1 Tax=Citricoccus parietis TaxID=592307 RepID=A0ABV5G179_9MICC
MQDEVGRHPAGSPGGAIDVPPGPRHPGGRAGQVGEVHAATTGPGHHGDLWRRGRSRGPPGRDAQPA